MNDEPPRPEATPTGGWSTQGEWKASANGGDMSPRSPVQGDGVFGRLFTTLYDTSGPPWRYVLRVWPLATLPTLGIAMVLVLLAHLVGRADWFDGNQWDFNVDSKPLLFVEVVIGAPLLETMVMAPLLALLRRFVRRPGWVIGLSALVWACLHSLSVPVWGLCIFWTFVVFSAAFEAWRPRGFWYAYFVTAGIHAMNNALAGMGLFL